MKKLFGLLLCVGLFLTGQVVYGSPPGDAGQYETIDVFADTSAPGAVNMEVLVQASHLAAAQASAELVAGLSAVTDTSPLMQLVADLRTNAVNRKLVPRLIDESTVHRWRHCSNHYAGVQIDKIYRPGWKRKVCVG